MHKQLSFALVILLAGGLLWFGLRGRESASGAPCDSHAATAEKVSAKAEEPAALPSPKAVLDAAPPQNDSRWPKAAVLERGEFATNSSDITRRVTLLQVPDMPYPVRVEEHLRHTREGVGEVLKLTEMVADRVIVRLPEGVSPDNFDAAFASGNMRIHKRISSLGIYTVSIPMSLEGVPDARALLEMHPHLARYAEPDHIVHATETPDDPRYLDGSLWALHNTGQDGGLDDADIDAPEGWAIRNSAGNIVAAVIDTGVRYTHEDIAANMWVNPGEDGFDAFGLSKRTNGVDDDENGYADDVHGINVVEESGNPMDDNRHGTHCAGTIAAVGNNAMGVVGVAWEAKIMALKFMGAAGDGAISGAIRCIDYAVAMGADLTSNSYGGSDYSQALFDAISMARDAGQLFIAAAGNNSADNDVMETYPANLRLENIISVAATTRDDTLADFSNFGSGSVEIGAPGENILSLGIESDFHYLSLSGTSMATPHVAGLAALLHAQFPESDAFGIRNRLLRGGRPLHDLEGKTNSGCVINLPGALTTTTDAPPNDSFAEAFPIGPDPDTVRSTNRHATSEPGEPQHAGFNGNSVWYRYEAATPGTTIVHTLHSSFDTVLAVYTGDSVDALTLVAANDDDGARSTSRLSFEAVAGTTYHLVLAGKNGTQGYLELGVAGPPREDNLANAAVPSRFPFTYSSDNTLASRESGEALHAGEPGGGSLWVRFSLADWGVASQNIVLTTAGSSIDTLLAVYTAPVPDPSPAELVAVASNDNASYGDTQSEVSFMADSTSTYWIAIDGKNDARGAVKLWGHPKPVNDDFDDSLTLPSETEVSRPVSLTDLYHATREPGEPIHDNASLGTSLWWTWSPPVPGAYVLRTNANTSLGVYIGSSVESLTLAAPDQNDGATVSHVLLADAVPTTTYRIALDQREASAYLREVQLYIEPFAVVSYDNLASAETIVGIPSGENPFSGSNRNATLEPGEPTDFGYMERTVWVKWTAPISGLFAAHTHWSSFNSSLAVYSGPAVATDFSQLALIKNDWDAGIFDDAWFSFDAVAGQTYYFQIGGDDAAEFGDFQLAIEAFAPPANDHLAAAEILTGFFVQRLVPNFGATREPGEPDHATNDDWHNDDDIFYFTEVERAYQTLWYKWTPVDSSQARRTTAGTFGSGTYTVVAVYETTAVNPTFADLSMVTPGASMMWGSWWPWGEISWNAEPGKTYYIMLGTDLEDNYEELAFTFWQNPNDDFATREVIPSQSTVSVHGANYAATRESGEPTITNPWGSMGGRSQWYEWTAPESGLFVIDTYGSHNKSYFGRMSPIPARNTMQMLLGVYTGDSPTNLATVATNAGVSIHDYNARIIFNAVKGTSYKIALDTRVGPGSVLNEHRTQWVYRCLTQLNISRGILPNDNLADAKVIQGTHHDEFIDISFATREPGEPSHGGRAMKSAWWKWVAPESGDFRVATASDIFADNHNRKPGIAVYEGPYFNPAFPDLVELASDDGGPDRHNPARTSFNAIAGHTYYIAVDTGGADNDFYGFGTGLFLGHAPPNDDFENATVVSGSRAVAQGHNIGSTEQAGEPNIDPNWKKAGATNSSVWWRWTAPASGPVTIGNEPGSFIYTELGVYTGTSVNALTEVAKEITSIHFDNGDSYEKRVDLGCRTVTFNAVAGTTYHIMLNGSGWQKTSQGLITLTITGQPGIPFAPENIVAHRINDVRVDLMWTPVAVDAANYVIERSASDSGLWQQVFDSGESDTATWSDLDATGPFHYRVRAQGPGGVSEWVTVHSEANTPPTITAIPPQVLPQNSVGPVIPFSVHDHETEASALTVSIASSNTAIFPLAGIALDGTGQDRSLRLIPAFNHPGAAVITLTVSDGVLAASTSFTAVAAMSPIVDASALPAWRNFFFGTTDPLGEAADDADPDGDGLHNLLEFAFDSDPRNAADGPLPQPGISRVSGPPSLTLSFTPEVVAGLRFFIEPRNDPSFSQDPVEVTGSLQQGIPYLYLDSSDLNSTPSRFLRLLVTPTSARP
ncbi:MAG: S8 family serine peptidase [Oceanipulchritudo sp.]